MCRRAGSPNRLPACSEEPKGGSGGIQLRQCSHLQNHLIPVRTRPLADTAYYPLVDILSAGGFVARWRATREGTADHHQVTAKQSVADYPPHPQNRIDDAEKCGKCGCRCCWQWRSCFSRAGLAISALSWPFSTAAAGASRTPTASRRHLRTAQAWWCTARMHNSAVSESFTGPNGPLGCHTQRGHAPSSSNLRRGTAWQRALKRADIVAPRSTLILAHAHKPALHAPQCCMVWRSMCWVLHRMVPRATRQNPASWHTVWKRAFRAKSGTQPSTDPRSHTHTQCACARA